jgi:hypothetical protein
MRPRHLSPLFERNRMPEEGKPAIEELRLRIHVLARSEADRRLSEKGLLPSPGETFSTWNEWVFSTDFLYLICSAGWKNSEGVDRVFTLKRE